MNIKYTFPALAIFALAGTCSADTLMIINSNFSDVPVVCDRHYAYPSTDGGCSSVAPLQDFNSNPAIGWTFSDGSGLTGPGSAFNPPDFAGLFGQAAFLQGNSSISQSVDAFLDTETYTASFYLGSRYNDSPNDGNQTVDVKLDGHVIDEYILATRTPFSLITTDAFTVTAGTHLLSFEGEASGDHTAFVSAVSLTGTPEPSTFFLIGGGLMSLWSIGKHKRRA